MVSHVVHIVWFKYDVILWLVGICVEIYFPLNLCYDVLCCSLHGLVRGENMELGRDSDTGGQVILSVLLIIGPNRSAFLS